MFISKKKKFLLCLVCSTGRSLSLSLSLAHTPPLSKLTPLCDLLRKIIVCFQIDFELTLSFVSLFYTCNLEVAEKMTSGYIK